MRLKFLFSIFLVLTISDMSVVFSKNDHQQKKKILLKKTKKRFVNFTTDATSEDPTLSGGQSQIQNTPSVQSERAEKKDSFSRQAARAIAKTIVYINQNKAKIAIIGGVTVAATVGIAYLVDPTSTAAATGWVVQKFVNWAQSPMRFPEDMEGKEKNAQRAGNIFNNTIETIVKKIIPSPYNP